MYPRSSPREKALAVGVFLTFLSLGLFALESHGVPRIELFVVLLSGSSFTKAHFLLVCETDSDGSDELVIAECCCII